MRIVKAWFLVTGATVLLASLPSGCFLTPECTGCTDASTGGSGAGGGGAGSTTATISDDENCTNGADDDGDGDVDCADSDCTPDFECIPGLPDGWIGPYEISVVDFKAELPACESGKDPDVFFAELEPPTCAPCECEPPQGEGAGDGATCSPPQISCYPGSTNCDGDALDWTPGLVDGQCHQPQSFHKDSPLSCKIVGDPQAPEGVTCTASGGELLESDPWKKRIGACTVPTGDGCDAEQLCAAVSPVGHALCVRREGDTTCPPGPFTAKTLVYSAQTGDPACEVCTCTPTCTGGSYTVHDYNDCPDDDDVKTIDSDTCHDVSALLDGPWWDDTATWSIEAILPQLARTCMTGGGTLTGEPTAMGPVTFCCQP